MILEERIYPPITKRTAYFLKGPVSFDWLRKAACLPGKSLHVAILIWFHYQLTKKTWFYLQTKFLKEFQISRRCLYSSLRALERAHLIETERNPGKKILIRVVNSKI